MMRALTLCSLLLLPMSACDDAAFDLVESAERPSPIPDPPDASVLDTCELYCSEYRVACGSEHFGYASLSECESLCGYWEAEEDSDCRLEALHEIAGGTVKSLAETCADAGPDSDTCGSAYVVTCPRYCDEFRATCGGEGSFDDAFESREKCLAWCDGEPLHRDDDSISCRLGALESVAAPPDCVAASPDTSCK
ncbi:MAG: hypothetical protein ACRBN8_37645 [Nannocystales bacterium]